MVQHHTAPDAVSVSAGSGGYVGGFAGEIGRWASLFLSQGRDNSAVLAQFLAERQRQGSRDYPVAETLVDPPAILGTERRRWAGRHLPFREQKESLYDPSYSPND